MVKTKIKTKTKKSNYISKYDLLEEISKSKMSYSWVLDSKYIEFDNYIDDLNDITDEYIKITKQKRARRLTHELLRNLAKEQGNSYKSMLKEKHLYEIDYNTINKEDVVIRLRTNEHIETEIKKNGKEALIKINFPPFKHYAYIDNKLTEVVRSHWKGDLETGCFSFTHGKLTNKLSSIIIQLADKFSLHSKFRKYSYRDELAGEARVHLCINCLKFDETKCMNSFEFDENKPEVPNPHAYMTQISENQFKIVLNSEKKQQRIRDDLIEINGYTPSFTRQNESDDDIVSAEFYKETINNLKLMHHNE